MNKNFNIKTVLIAPLDWGLGHATRCIPIIKALLAKDYKVIVATDGKSKTLLQQEFPELFFVQLKGYQIEYSKNKLFLPIKILSQVPKIVQTIRYEHQWLKKIILVYNIDLVISDNRFGLNHSIIPCIFITHQLTIQTPFSWLTSWVQKINYSYINRFTTCWIPDVAGKNNMAGVLSHPKKLPSIPVEYIGLLSRFQQIANNQMQYKICVLISGPEPQRTIFENTIFNNIAAFKEKIIVLRGLPNTIQSLPSTQNCTVHNHLAGDTLEQILQQSEYIICRSGYTSLMELLTLQKKCIVVPTPGQTEQEFLAHSLNKQGWCFSESQHKFNLIESYTKAQQFNYCLPQFEVTKLQKLIPQLVEKLNN